MKTFIIKLLFFICTSIVLYTATFYYFKYNLKNEISKSDIIILGDSHTMFIDIPNSFNYSNYGFPYILHFNFINEFKGVLKNKKILIVYSQNNISNEFQNRFDSRELRPNWLSMVNQHLNSFNLLPNTYFKKYKWYDPNLGMFRKEKLEKLNIIKNTNTSKVSTDTTLFANKIIEHYTNPLYIKRDSIQLEYLYKSINILKQNKNKIILLNTPKTKFYTNHIPNNIIKKHNTIIKDLKLNYLDLNAILVEELDSSCFMDADHTNTKGDIIVNDYLKKDGTLFLDKVHLLQF